MKIVKICDFLFDQNQLPYTNIGTGWGDKIPSEVLWLWRESNTFFLSSENDYECLGKRASS